MHARREVGDALPGARQLRARLVSRVLPTSSPRRPRPRPPLRRPRPLRPRGLLGVVVPRGREGASGRKAGPAAGEPGNYNCGDRSASPGLRTARRPMTGDHAGLQNKRLCRRCGPVGGSVLLRSRPPAAPLPLAVAPGNGAKGPHPVSSPPDTGRPRGSRIYANEKRGLFDFKCRALSLSHPLFCSLTSTAGAWMSQPPATCGDGFGSSFILYAPDVDVVLCLVQLPLLC